MKYNKFIESSLRGTLSFLRASVFSDGYALEKGFLQSIDPRINLLTVIIFLVTALFTRNMVVVLCLYGVCLALASLSRINLGFFLKRTWIFIPLFSLFIAIPALFNIITPGDELAGFTIGGVSLAITRQGLSGAALFVARVITSVSFVVLLSLTTRHFALLKVLRVFRIPKVFVMVLGISYRYIYLFIEIIENTYLAIKSRAGGEIPRKQGRHIVAGNIASLWLRSYRMNEAVYGAMVARGYDGEPVLANDFKTKTRDWVWLSLVLVAVLVLFYFSAQGRFGSI
ncbi:MAG: cobalt ECF transporter T component CbiQ [Candidatus Omnitrophica bacterium]|nr:cobalt ECF transporter T component CbiQ [Candidatus Omnitrophota bacterium]